jgi:hypothetical protein
MAARPVDIVNVIGEAVPATTRPGARFWSLRAVRRTNDESDEEEIESEDEFQNTLGELLQIEEGTDAALRCPVCGQIQRRIVQCKIGHAICVACKSKIITCPVCRAVYNDPPTRNFAMEQLIEQSTIAFNCTNASNGCEFIAKTTDLVVHEIDCPKRKVQCIVRSISPYCFDRIDADDIVNHLDSHPDIIKQVVPCNPFIQSYLISHSIFHARHWRVYKHSFDGQTFVNIFRTYEHIFYAYTVLLGGPTLAKDYKVRIEITCDEFELKSTWDVYSIDKDFKDIQRDCFHLDPAQIENYLHAGDGGVDEGPLCAAALSSPDTKPRKLFTMQRFMRKA